MVPRYDNKYDAGVHKHFKRCLQHSNLTLEKQPGMQRILDAAFALVKVEPPLPVKGIPKDGCKYLRQEQRVLVEAYLGSLMCAGALMETTPEEVAQNLGTMIENPLFLKEDSENGDWDFRVILDARNANKYVKWDKVAATALKRLIPLMREKQSIATHITKVQIGALKYHSKVDLLGAYYQVRLPGKLKYYTTFRWDGRLYCFNAMPYGLGIASSVLNVMTKYLVGQIW
jgi:hypothetical protein